MHELWSLLMRSYEPRIKVYASQARQALENTHITPHILENTVSALHNRPLLRLLVDFQALVQNTPRLSTQEGLEEAVERAYDICCIHNEQEFESIACYIPGARSLRKTLGFLGRLRKCFKTLIRGAERISPFQNIRIIPVTTLPAGRARQKKGKSADDWSLAMTFSSLDLILDDQTVKSMFKSGKRKGPWTKDTLLSRYNELKSPISEVHAEVQVVLAATRHECKGASILEYVGCSKHSCFLCSKFILKYGQFRTRGCHGKIYSRWTIPQVSWLAPDECLRIVKILGDIENNMENSIKSKKPINVPHAQESTIGGSSVATVRRHFGNPYAKTLASQHLQTQRDDMFVGTGEDIIVGRLRLAILLPSSLSSANRNSAPIFRVRI